MRNLLLLALILYDIVVQAMRGNYDYEDMDKRHYLGEDRRNYKKKMLLNEQGKDWEDRRRQEIDNMRFTDEMERRNGELGSFRGLNRRYDDVDKMISVKSSEMGLYTEKDADKKQVMNCDRPHERFETCFSGCAAVTCDNPRERLRPCYPFCEPGCICVHPHVRDDRTHKCVLPEDCSKGLKGIPDIGDDA